VFVLIPMAGRGSRFAEKGYDLPKPLIDVNGRPMVERVIDNLGIDGPHIFIVRSEHKSQLAPVLSRVRPGCVVIGIDQVTQGAACTCLLARELINNDEQLLVANCDQIMDWDPRQFADFVKEDLDGSILTFTSQSPNNSYAKLNRHGYVTRVAEKEVISEVATCGVYHFSKGRYLVESCEKMIAAGRRCRGEFYLCPCYNEMIEDGLIVKTYPVKAHHPIGTPEELEKYLGHLQVH